MTFAQMFVRFTVLLLPTLGYAKPVEEIDDSPSESPHSTKTRAVVYFGEVLDVIEDDDFYLGPESAVRRQRRSAPSFPQVFRNAYTKPGKG